MSIRVKGHSKIIMSIVAAMGGILYGAGTRLFSINPLIPYWVAIITVPLTENNFVIEIVKECKKQHKFAWSEKSVRTNILALLITLLFL